MRTLRAAAVLLALAAGGCSGFNDYEPGWHCRYYYSYEAYDGSSCSIHWSCENNTPVHLGAEDDPDPRLRVYMRHVDCDAAPGGTKGYSCACFQDNQHLTTFMDTLLCEYAERPSYWWDGILDRAEAGCTWPPLPR